MDIQLDREEAMKMLQETDDHSLIIKVKKMLAKKKKDWWDDLTEEQKEEIKLGERQIENGEYSDFECFIEKYI